ncbi:SIP domain-containing protein [Actinomadura atramentaria]|uniref:SIP domain-containing protein n=1 Tax=Actinomadura atramentaria TaxID=1990 RepID=UPI00146DA5DD|nr:SIP domain-containing protein [Actinomadura atramentaria]
MLGSAPRHLFVGDGTASVAMPRVPDPATPVRGTAETSGPDDRPPLPRAADLLWYDRDPVAPGGLVAVVRALGLPGEPGRACVVGEARAVRATRRHRVAGRGRPRRAVTVRPFWRPGRTGTD